MFCVLEYEVFETQKLLWKKCCSPQTDIDSQEDL